MSNLSAYLGNKLIRWIAGNAMPTAPVAVYVALFDGDPHGAGTEVTTTVRVAGRVAASWAAPVAGVDNNMDNNADSDFGASAGNTNITHVALYDAAAAGNLLFGMPLPGGTVAITIGTTVKVATGSMTMTVGTPGA